MSAHLGNEEQELFMNNFNQLLFMPHQQFVKHVLILLFYGCTQYTAVTCFVEGEV